ncbi:MAG: 50S ribosomal protein L29 [Dehalococcoidales bacterium]|nr:50S ribosomal protein L29 [Dehalococcoidales bacterium]
MKANEIRAMSTEEMNKQLQAAYQQLWDLRLKANTRQLVNHREIPRVKKQIAALKTILRERALESQERPA